MGPRLRTSRGAKPASRSRAGGSRSAPARSAAPSGSSQGANVRARRHAARRVLEMLLELGAERGSITRPRELRQQPARTGDLLRRQARQRVLKRLTRQQLLEAINCVRAAARPPACAGRRRRCSGTHSSRNGASIVSVMGVLLPSRAGRSPRPHISSDRTSHAGTRARPSPPSGGRGDERVASSSACNWVLSSAEMT